MEQENPESDMDMDGPGGARPRPDWRHLGAGRPGRRALLVERLIADFEANGPVAFARARASHTATYLKLAAAWLGSEGAAADDDCG